MAFLHLCAVIVFSPAGNALTLYVMFFTRWLVLLLQFFVLLQFEVAGYKLVLRFADRLSVWILSLCFTRLYIASPNSYCHSQ